MEIRNLIEDLNQEIRQCHQCRFSETRKNALGGEGNLHAVLMLIAQAPGEQEDNEEIIGRLIFFCYW